MRRVLIVFVLMSALLGIHSASAETTRWVWNEYYGPYTCDGNGQQVYREHEQYYTEQYYDYYYHAWLNTGNINWVHLASYPHVHRHYISQWCS
jgi:hypothetical protein